MNCPSGKKQISPTWANLLQWLELRMFHEPNISGFVACLTWRSLSLYGSGIHGFSAASTPLGEPHWAPSGLSVPQRWAWPSREPPGSRCLSCYKGHGMSWHVMAPLKSALRLGSRWYTARFEHFGYRISGKTQKKNRRMKWMKPPRSKVGLESCLNTPLLDGMEPMFLKLLDYILSILD